ncbi:hypothetical protein K438DRAFT_1972414 [Mycena galopus ATCC 62051]|nr:hypothetical protein K438DRAFT_1972414 [Mycena galopus ATCC 62051]
MRGTLRFRGSLLRTPSSSVQTPVRTSGRSDPPDVRTLRSSGHPDAPILRTSGRSSIVTSPGHLSLGIPLSGRSSGLPDIPSVGPFNFRLPDLDPHLRFRTRFPDPSNEPRTSRSSSQHSPSSLLFPLLHSPDLATVTPSDPFLSSAPDVRPGPPEPPEPPYTQPPGLHPLSPLSPSRILSSGFRPPTSEPRTPCPVFRTSDLRLRTPGTSGRPPVVPLLVHRVDQPPSGIRPAPPPPILRASGPDLCLVRILGPGPGSPSSETSGTSGQCPSRLLGSSSRPTSLLGISQYSVCSVGTYLSVTYLVMCGTA